jgi:integrase
VNLGKRDLLLLATGWGEIHLNRATPYTGRAGRIPASRATSDSSNIGPKARAALFRVHPSWLHCYESICASSGRTMKDGCSPGERGGEVPTITYERVWRQARRATFTPEVCASPLARCPYDLRHAAISTWLKSGVPAPEVAEWAGHSVAVLLEVYAKCLEGGRQGATARVEAALGWGRPGWEVGGSGT